MIITTDRDLAGYVRASLDTFVAEFDVDAIVAEIEGMVTYGVTTTGELDELLLWGVDYWAIVERHDLHRDGAGE